MAIKVAPVQFDTGAFAKGELAAVDAAGNMRAPTTMEKGIYYATQPIGLVAIAAGLYLIFKRRR